MSSAVSGRQSAPPTTLRIASDWQQFRKERYQIQRVMKKDKNIEKPIVFLMLIDMLALITLVIEFIYFTVTAFE